jgi:hypothetical protein
MVVTQAAKPARMLPRPLLPILLYLLISLAGTPDFSRVTALVSQLVGDTPASSSRMP